MNIVIDDLDIYIYDKCLIGTFKYKRHWIKTYQVDDPYSITGFSLKFNYDLLLNILKLPLDTYIIDQRTSY